MMVQFVRMACWLGERVAHPRRDESFKIKLDVCRRRMKRLVGLRFLHVSFSVQTGQPPPIRFPQDRRWEYLNEYMHHLLQRLALQHIYENKSGNR
jgi:hypothetical protein